VAEIGVRFIDGQVVDYTVQVSDRDGSFYVWARNLDRALALPLHLAAAANDNEAWREPKFSFGMGAAA
jgi:hypothetical protein